MTIGDLGTEFHCFDKICEDGTTPVFKFCRTKSCFSCKFIGEFGSRWRDKEKETAVIRMGLHIGLVKESEC